MQPVSPLAAPLAHSIIERAMDLDEGQFKALQVNVTQNGSAAARALERSRCSKTGKKHSPVNKKCRARQLLSWALFAETFIDEWL